MLGFLTPSRRDDRGHLLVGQVGQSGEHVAEVGVGLDATPTAAFDDGVNDRATFAGVGFADEQPVLFSQGSGPDRVFDQIVVGLDAAVVQEHLQRRPLAQRIIDRDPERALGQLFAAGLEVQQDALQPGDDQTAFAGAHGLTQLRAGLLFPQCGLDGVEVLDLP